MRFKVLDFSLNDNYYKQLQAFTIIENIWF